jgi:hypothetical protein
MTDGINVMKVSYKEIQDIDIISFIELPEERQNFALSDIENRETFVADMQLAIKNCLLNPARWEEFENLSEEELYEFFWKWAISSTLNNETI